MTLSPWWRLTLDRKTIVAARTSSSDKVYKWSIGHKRPEGYYKFGYETAQSSEPIKEQISSLAITKDTVVLGTEKGAILVFQEHLRSHKRYTISTNPVSKIRLEKAHGKILVISLCKQLVLGVISGGVYTPSKPPKFHSKITDARYIKGAKGPFILTTGYDKEKVPRFYYRGNKTFCHNHESFEATDISDEGIILLSDGNRFNLTDHSTRFLLKVDDKIDNVIPARLLSDRRALGIAYLTDCERRLDIINFNHLEGAFEVVRMLHLENRCCCFDIYKDTVVLGMDNYVKLYQSDFFKDRTHRIDDGIEVKKSEQNLLFSGILGLEALRGPIVSPIRDLSFQLSLKKSLRSCLRDIRPREEGGTTPRKQHSKYYIPGAWSHSESEASSMEDDSEEEEEEANDSDDCVVQKEEGRTDDSPSSNSDDFEEEEPGLLF